MLKKKIEQVLYAIQVMCLILKNPCTSYRPHKKSKGKKANDAAKKISCSIKLHNPSPVS